jgi:hypothetical protein
MLWWEYNARTVSIYGVIFVFSAVLDIYQTPPQLKGIYNTCGRSGEYLSSCLSERTELMSDNSYYPVYLYMLTLGFLHAVVIRKSDHELGQIVQLTDTEGRSRFPELFPLQYGS